MLDKPKETWKVGEKTAEGLGTQESRHHRELCSLGFFWPHCPRLGSGGEAIWKHQETQTEKAPEKALPSRRTREGTTWQNRELLQSNQPTQAGQKRHRHTPTIPQQRPDFQRLPTQ